MVLSLSTNFEVHVVYHNLETCIHPPTHPLFPRSLPLVKKTWKSVSHGSYKLNVHKNLPHHPPSGQGTHLAADILEYTKIIWSFLDLSITFDFFFLIYLFIYLFIYFWLCWVFVSVRGLPLVAVSGGHSSSRCAGLSLSRPLLLWSTGSRRAGSVVVVHAPSCSVTCGILPDQGSNPCPLHRQAASQPLRHQGSPTFDFWDEF